MYSARLNSLPTSVESAIQTFGAEIQGRMYAGRLHSLQACVETALQTFATD